MYIEIISTPHKPKAELELKDICMGDWFVRRGAVLPYLKVFRRDPEWMDTVIVFTEPPDCHGKMSVYHSHGEFMKNYGNSFKLVNVDIALKVTPCR